MCIDRKPTPIHPTPQHTHGETGKNANFLYLRSLSLSSPLNKWNDCVYSTITLVIQWLHLTEADNNATATESLFGWCGLWGRPERGREKKRTNSTRWISNALKNLHRTMKQKRTVGWCVCCVAQAHVNGGKYEKHDSVVCICVRLFAIVQHRRMRIVWSAQLPFAAARRSANRHTTPTEKKHIASASDLFSIRLPSATRCHLLRVLFAERRWRFSHTVRGRWAILGGIGSTRKGWIDNDSTEHLHDRTTSQSSDIHW